MALAGGWAAAATEKGRAVVTVPMGGQHVLLAIRIDEYVRIGRAEAARFERHSKCFERHSKVLRATQQKGWAPFRSLIPLTPYFRPRGSGGASDLRKVGGTNPKRQTNPKSSQ